MTLRSTFAALGFLLCTGGVASSAVTVDLTPSAQSPASAPRLSIDDSGELILSWIEEDDDGSAALKFSRLLDKSWSSPVEVARGEDWFVNWADTPGVRRLNDGSLLAHWLVENGEDAHAYSILMSLSLDGGESWGEAFSPHADETKTQHGFVSVAPNALDRAWVMWLDGRRFVRGSDAFGDTLMANEEMQLRASWIASDGATLRESVLDTRTCECCPIDAVALGSRVAVVYRDRSGTDIRDIALVRHDGRRWLPPTIIAQDSWKVGGCPVNGPAIAADGERLAVAWFTAANNEPSIRFAWGGFDGAKFSKPVQLHGSGPLGRVDVTTRDGLAWVLWMESRDESTADLKLRSISHDGTLGEPRAVGSLDPGRSSGNPQLASVKQGLVIAWTTGGEKPRLRAIMIPEHTLH